MSRAFTLVDLKKHIFVALGEDDDIDLTDATSSDDLRDLGVDSLAVIDAAGRIEKDLHIKFPEGATSSIDTFGEFLAVVHKAQFDTAGRLEAGQA